MFRHCLCPAPKKWWSRRALEQFAVAHLSLSVGVIGQTIERVAGAVMETRAMLVAHAADFPEFRETGAAMVAAWDEGLAGLAGRGD